MLPNTLHPDPDLPEYLKQHYSGQEVQKFIFKGVCQMNQRIQAGFSDVVPLRALHPLTCPVSLHGEHTASRSSPVYLDWHPTVRVHV